MFAKLVANYFLLALLTLGLIVAFTIYIWKRKQHFKLFAQQNQAFEALLKASGPPNDKEDLMRCQFALIMQHEHRYCMDFLFTQIAGKLFEIMSLIFSVGVYVNNALETTSATWEQIYSFMAIVFIVITLYLSMSKRWAQYLLANRSVEKQIELVLSEKITVSEALSSLHLTEESLTSVSD